MLPKKVIRNLNEWKAFVRQLKALSRTYDSVQKIAAEKTADEAVLTPIHFEMESENISKKIIQTTYVGKIEIDPGKAIRIPIISDYVADNGFDVGEAREEGTKRHFIAPKKKKTLSWIDTKTGKRRFDPIGHYVSGLPRLLIVERNIAKSKETARASYENNITDAVNQVLGG